MPSVFTDSQNPGQPDLMPEAAQQAPKNTITVNQVKPTCGQILDCCRSILI